MADTKVDLSTLLASSIHDTKNSLGMVLNSLDELLEQAGPDGECRCPAEKVGQLQYEARRLNDNLIQLLTIYRLEKHHYSPDIREWAISDFMADTVALHGPLLEFRNVGLELRCPQELHGYFDRDLVAGVLNNAINNALRYTRDRLRLSVTEAQGGLRFSVEDNGSGFPQAMLVSGSGSAIDFGAGRTGLGLYFSSLVAGFHRNGEHRGHIELTNGGELGGGRFSLYLP